MGAVNRREDDATWKIRVERTLRAVRDRVGNISAYIGEGGLTVGGGGEFTVRHENGNWLFHVGRGSQGNYFLTIRRDNGAAAFEIGTTETGQQFWAGWDGSGNVAIADDAKSGQGLARPWLPQGTINVLSTSIPLTSATSWIATQSTGQMLKQQPYAEVEALLLSTGGGVGEARFTINGTPAGNVMPIGAGSFAWQTIQTFALPGSVNSRATIDLQVQRTNAAGSIGGVFRCTQRQSP
ncbi:hypothetical protein [Saccharothrix lopnurensis]|uniref:Uncharacterized protein n=1 Tax=Saccharothrix lopnurensis TaxID=1670621 RepID=A0ABW1PIS0_9PSEU